MAGRGFRITLPNSWAAYELSPDGAVRAVDGAAPLPTELNGLAVASAVQGGSIFAVTPADADGQSTTMMVTVLGADELPATADVSETLRARLADDGIADLEVTLADLGGRDAARATFRQTGETGLEQEALAVYVPGQGSSFLLTFSQPLPRPSGTTDVVDDIVESFRIL